MCMLLSPGRAGVDRQQLVTIVHSEEGQREMPEQFLGWDPRGAGTGALEADSGTGVRKQSAGGRVTWPAWVQMALHMALLLPEPWLLRQHLRSRQALAGTLQTSLSLHSCLDLEGQWVCKWQAALPQAGESYLVTFQKTVPTSLCPGMNDLPAPGKIKKKQSKPQWWLLHLSQNYRQEISHSLPRRPLQHYVALIGTQSSWEYWIWAQRWQLSLARYCAPGMELTLVLVKGPWMVDMVPEQLVLMLPAELAFSTLDWNAVFFLPAFYNHCSDCTYWWDLHVESSVRLALARILQWLWEWGHVQWYVTQCVPQGWHWNSPGHCKGASLIMKWQESEEMILSGSPIVKPTSRLIYSDRIVQLLPRTTNSRSLVPFT